MQANTANREANLHSLMILGSVCGFRKTNFSAKPDGVIWPLVPMQGRVGDRIYVADGSEAPLVVRRRAKGEGWSVHEEKCKCGRWEGGFGEGNVTRGVSGMYEFVGPAYVHGIMDGEAIVHRLTEGMREKETGIIYLTVKSYTLVLN